MRRMDDEAVSEMVASVLLVAITVVLAVIAGALILSRPGPMDTTRPDFQFSVNPGADGVWNNGNENVSIYHAGGEALQTGNTRIRINGGSPDREYSGTGLGAPFTQAGGFRIGTTWYSTSQTITIASGNVITISVVVTSDGGTRLAGSSQITAGG